MKQHQRELCTDRLAQLALKEELKKQQQQEEEMFAELWKEDRLAKERREAVDTQKLSQQNREILDVLGAQVAVLSAHKEEEKRLKEEEARLLVISRSSSIQYSLKVPFHVRLTRR